jgi:S1-C subfamily serine protease
MSVVDLVLILLFILFAVSGYRQGFVVGVLSFTGFFGGALIGLQLGPLLARLTDSDPLKLVISLITVFGLAVLGQTLAGWLGGKLRRNIVGRNGQVLDDIGGAIVSLIAVAIVAWLVAVPLGNASEQWLSSAVRHSVVIRGIDKLMPSQADKLTEALRDTVDTNGFPEVFGSLVPTQVREVPDPDSSLAKLPIVVKSEQSVVKILGTATSCSRRIEGSGFVYAPEHVMTNAHVVAGTKAVQIVLKGAKLNAKVVAYDSDLDLAVLHVPGLSAPVMPFVTKPAQTGDDAIVLGYPLDGPYNAQQARVRDIGDISGPDIYERKTVTREVYTIKGLVRSGNSGGPLINPEGGVIGVIFAAAADNNYVGYAVTAQQASGMANSGRTASAAVATGGCA